MKELKGVEVELMTIGKKANDILKRTGKITGSNNEIWNDLTYENNADIAAEIMEGYVEGKWDRVELIYNQFKNAAVQLVQTEQYLPISLKGDGNDSTDYIYEPNKLQIVEELIPISLKTQLFKALLDSNASEHGSRMTAMHKATDNAGELKADLSLEYNKARQAAITNEILDIVSGANALEG
jgi:F-type H+-transporting ATPase subunit gamma